MTVDEVLRQCRVAESSGQSRYFAMSYEQGVAAGVQWALGLTDDPPLDADEPRPGRVRQVEGEGLVRQQRSEGSAHPERSEGLVYRRPRRRRR